MDRLTAYAEAHPVAVQPTSAIADLRARHALARGRPKRALDPLADLAARARLDEAPPPTGRDDHGLTRRES